MSHTLADEQVDLLRKIALEMPETSLARPRILDMLPPEPLNVRIAISKADGNFLDGVNIRITQEERDEIENDTGGPLIDFLKDAIEIARKGRYAPDPRV